MGRWGKKCGYLYFDFFDTDAIFVWKDANLRQRPSPRRPSPRRTSLYLPSPHRPGLHGLYTSSFHLREIHFRGTRTHRDFGNPHQRDFQMSRCSL